MAGLAYIAFIVLAGTHQLGIFRRIIRHVPATNGHTCPKCVLPLTDGSEGSLACPKCERSFAGDSLAELLEVWQMLPNLGAAQAIRHTKSLVGAPRNPIGKAAFRLLPDKELTTRDIVKRSIIMTIVIAVPFVVGQIYMTVARGSGNIIQMLPLFVMFPIAFTLMALGSKRRRGDSLRCAACEYERLGATSERCPECGAAWGQPGTLVRGRVTRRPAFVAMGLAVLILVPLIQIGFMMKGASVLPNSMLIRRAASGTTSSFRARQELARRQLSPTEQLELARLYINTIEDEPLRCIHAAMGRTSFRIRHARARPRRPLPALGRRRSCPSNQASRLSAATISSSSCSPAGRSAAHVPCCWSTKCVSATRSSTTCSRIRRACTLLYQSSSTDERTAPHCTSISPF